MSSRVWIFMGEREMKNELFPDNNSSRSDDNEKGDMATVLSLKSKSWVSFLPSIPYPQTPFTAHWGPVTSTLDWCEENYYATSYIAELVNSLTNALFVYLALRGVRNVLREGHDKVFLWAYVMNLMIGLGSFCFHATLTYEMQLVDEISMLYTNMVLVYATFSNTRTKPVKVIIGSVVSFSAIAITLTYFYLGDPVFHQVAFTLLTLLLLFRGMYLMETTLRPRRKPMTESKQINGLSNGNGSLMKPKSQRVYNEKADLVLLSRMYGLIGYGLLTALAGFAVWSLDRIYCGKILAWRREMGMPWGFLLEGHAWWHILTGIGGYIHIVWNIWIRYALYNRREEVKLIWPSTVFSIPELVKNDKPKGA